jgi:hypothetical protein
MATPVFDPRGRRQVPRQRVLGPTPQAAAPRDRLDRAHAPATRAAAIRQPHAEQFAEAVRRTPDATTEEHRLALDAGLSHAAVWRGIKALALTLKKKS